MRRLVVVGDVLLDRDLDGRADRLCPDVPVPVVSNPVERLRPGGAALAAALAASDEVDVALVTAIGGDDAGATVRGLLERAGVEILDLGTSDPTGEKVRIRAGGHVVVRLDRGGDRSTPRAGIDREAATAIAGAAVVLAADYGRGVLAHGPVRDALSGPGGRRQLVWDPHPRGAMPVPGVQVVTPNAAEAGAFAGTPAPRTIVQVAAVAAALGGRWQAGGVAVTRGERGAVLVQGRSLPLVVPADPHEGDTCGAGDRFAAALAVALLAGAVPSEAVTHAVASASRYVAEGGAAGLGEARNGPASSMDDCPSSRDAFEVAARLRARGGTVVAAGGCFDLLHAGHVRLLEGARRLGDGLIVLLNSDRSVRELKGPGRPIVTAVDRAAVLSGLGCVDAVLEFDGRTPVEALGRLRPDVFAKGGDYGGGDLPEQAAMAGWGGQCVVLPYLAGRSTTTLCEEVQRRGMA